MNQSYLPQTQAFFHCLSKEEVSVQQHSGEVVVNVLRNALQVNKGVQVTCHPIYPYNIMATKGFCNSSDRDK